MTLAKSFQTELDNLLTYWRTHAPDDEHGGFFGQIDHDNQVTPNAPKGTVLNARILWTFSAAYRHQARPEDLAVATRAYHYIEQHFLDPEHGGVFWSVDYLGRPLDTKKQMYALAFALYGMAEYYAASGHQPALKYAKGLFRDIERHSFDPVHGGYFEALARDWSPLADLRLSAKDANEKKTMNTHLHILEAYATLYRHWPDAHLATQIRGLLTVFENHIINPTTNHLHLFLDEIWTPKSTAVSFGHDIEASWLLLEAAEALGDPALEQRFRQLAVPMAMAAAHGLEPSGGLNYEADPATGHTIHEKHWWVQAEALVGLLNAYQISGEPRFYEQFRQVWSFTRRYIIDDERGEWRWGLTPEGLPMPGEDKAGFWKCPYHNGRACLEVLRRLPAVAPPA